MSHEKGIEAADAFDRSISLDEGVPPLGVEYIQRIIAAYLSAAQPTSEGEEREAFEAVMRLHFKLPNATFDWAEGVPWMTDPSNTNGDIWIDCDDFWIGWQSCSAREGGKP